MRVTVGERFSEVIAMTVEDAVAFAKGNRIGAQMPPLHALEDEIVARLQ